MSRIKITIGEIAESAGLEVDDVLIRLWDKGLESYVSPDDVLSERDSRTAEELFGLASRKELLTPVYWQVLFNLKDEEYAEFLKSLGIEMSTKAKILPKGAIKKLRQALKKRAEQTAVVLPPAILPPPPPPIILTETARRRISEFEWKPVGSKKAPNFLSAEQIESIHWEIANDFANTLDPIKPAGVRSQSLLQGAAHRPRTSNGSTMKYSTPELATAALLHSLIHNHPFHNGNKRTALVSTLVSLDENGLMLTCEEDGLFPLMLRIAQHQVVEPGEQLPDREVLWIAEWIISNSRAIVSGEQPLSWRRLMKILNDFGCVVENSPGGKVNISRVVQRPGGIFRKARAEKLTTQVKYIGQDSRDVSPNTTHMIRRDLELDDDHNIDSLVFYSKAKSATDFIHRYRKTLKRLAKV